MPKFGSRALSSLLPHCGTLARSGALVGSIANGIDGRSAVMPGHTELAHDIGRDVIQRSALQQQRYRWLDAEIRPRSLPYPHRHKGINTELNQWHARIEGRMVDVAHDRGEARA
jgi:hypothetical protein